MSDLSGFCKGLLIGIFLLFMNGVSANAQINECPVFPPYSNFKTDYKKKYTTIINSTSAEAISRHPIAAYVVLGTGGAVMEWAKSETTMDSASSILAATVGLAWCESSAENQTACSTVTEIYAKGYLQAQHLKKEYRHKLKVCDAERESGTLTTKHHQGNKYFLDIKVSNKLGLESNLVNLVLTQKDKRIRQKQLFALGNMTKDELDQLEKLLIEELHHYDHSTIEWSKVIKVPDNIRYMSTNGLVELSDGFLFIGRDSPDNIIIKFDLDGNKIWQKTKKCNCEFVAAYEESKSNAVVLSFINDSRNGGGILRQRLSSEDGESLEKKTIKIDINSSIQSYHASTAGNLTILGRDRKNKHSRLLRINVNGTIEWHKDSKLDLSALTIRNGKIYVSGKKNVSAESNKEKDIVLVYDLKGNLLDTIDLTSGWGFTKFGYSAREQIVEQKDLIIVGRSDRGNFGICNYESGFRCENNALISHVNLDTKNTWNKTFGGIHADEFFHVFTLNGGNFLALGISSKPIIGKDFIYGVTFNSEGKVVSEKTYLDNKKIYGHALRAIKTRDGSIVFTHKDSRSGTYITKFRP